MGITGYTDRDVSVRGLKLHYQEWGEPGAPAIVMLHGFGVSGHMFDEFAERLQSRFRLIALDQRGHGDSDWAEDGDYSREAFVEDLEAVREALGLKTFLLVGHSMGGLNAVAYTAKYPERVRALVLVDVGPEAAKEGVDNIVRFTRGPDELEFEEFVQMAHQFNPRRSIENIRDRMRHRLRQMESGKWTWKFDRRFRQEKSGLRIGSELSNDEVWQLYRSVRVPTLLVRGAESDVLTQEVAERVAREMHQARLVVVRGAGHSVPGDNPDDFSAAVESFLEDVASGRFEPEAAAEPPPLQELVEEQEAARRRGPGTMALLAIGAGIVLSVAAAVFVTKRAVDKRADQRRREEEARRARRIGNVPLPPVPAAVGAFDIEQARQRASEIVGQLSVVGRDGVSRARTVLQETDLQAARDTALDLAHTLEERAKSAPEAVRSTVEKVDRKELKKRGGKAAKKGRGAVGTALALAIPGRKPKESRRSRLAKRMPWRG
ncbi:MAG: alpha/beta hydrolase [Dehalococcoidia bacterium]|nr:alpha/beta hydrolase [Dehalococcoidia bacterium]